MNLFGKAKKAPPPKETLDKLRETASTLQKREEYLNAKVMGEMAQAKKLARTNQKAALMCLKRKKMYEAQVQQLAGTQMNIEQQINAIEGTATNVETINVMKMAAKQMKKMHNNMTVEDIDDTMVEIQEQMDVANEIGEALGQSMGQQFDEADLLDELDLLEQEEVENQLMGVQNVPATSLPSVPTAA
eukprot:Ihof_evm3s540 gene=Ihof_evmTU3s540